MEPSELRIGNLVEYLGTQTSVYFLEEKAHLEISSCVNYSDLQPIPITEEWLEKFGFENTENEFWFKKEFNDSNPFSIYINKKGRIGIKKIDVFIDLAGSKRILYIHELQNLIASLTQTELKIK